jgi:hypothetical protein
MTIQISPHYIDRQQLVTTLKTTGYAVLRPSCTLELLECSVTDAAAWLPSWYELPLDMYLKDGGHYRRRRHACFTVTGQQVTQSAHRAHWQPVEYNALYGGMQRLFEPMLPQVVQSPAWTRLLSKLGQLCTALKPVTTTWFTEAHQFRIDTTDGIGRPTPEGAHRDGVETRVFNSAGTAGQRFTLTEPWAMLLLDDEQVIHESTPIQPQQSQSKIGYRDTLVLTFRANAFQGEAV